MSDRICTITHDLSGIRINGDCILEHFKQPLDVAHTYVSERYKSIDLQKRINDAASEITRSMGKSAEADKILDDLQRILAGP